MLKQESWDAAKRLFDEALAMDAVRRDAFLRDACHDAPDVYAEVQSLLEWHDGATGFLETPAAKLAPAEALGEHESLVGHALGVWRVTDVIGRGGMGVVYRAERGDAAFQRQVAVKVLRRGANAADIVARFRRERETLASLDHPNIARLLDGGTTPGGEPYFVMEYVDGKRVDAFCDAAVLTVQQRLEIFRTICQAVRSAHRNLVVHRDLKPDNILVSKEGVVKLLDFGIATLISDGAMTPDAHEATASTWLMTPDYASPEQLAGRAVTTASDVYSLGVLLYVLLTGERPYRLGGTTPDALQAELSSSVYVPASARVAVESPGVRERAAARSTTPAALARIVAGDLDAILERALSRDPERRYASVEQLLDDLERHRTRHPVSARPNDVVYVVARFVQRHAVAVGAAAIMVVLAAAGVAGVVWQARIAAEARARAERRFNDVRELAHAFMFDVHDEIVNLPGTTKARELMVRTASQYLQSLVPESAGDLTLQRELATAFVRLGDAQGHPTSSSLGATADARASYDEAIRIAAAVLAAEPDDLAARRTFAMAHRKQADVLAWTGDMTSALTHCETSREQFAQVASHPQATAEDRFQRAVADVKLGDLLGNPNLPNLGRPEEALARYDAALAVLREADSAQLSTQRIRRYIGLAFERIGSVQERMQRTDAAAAAYQQSFTIRQALAAAAPLHTDIQRDLAIAYEKIGNVQMFGEDVAAAVASYRGALEQFERLARADPSNATAARSVAISRENLARALAAMGDRREAAGQLSAALETHRTLAASDGTNVQAQCDVARLVESIGDLTSSSVAACGLWQNSLAARKAMAAASARCASPADLERLTGKLRACR